jgi:hypothetical protein
MQVNSNQYYKQQNTVAFGCPKCKVLDKTLGAYGLKPGKIPAIVDFSTKLSLETGRLSAFHEFKKSNGLSEITKALPELDRAAEDAFMSSQGAVMKDMEKDAHNEIISTLDDYYSGLINSGNIGQLNKEIQDINSKPDVKPETAVSFARQIVNFVDHAIDTVGKLPESEKVSKGREKVKDFFEQGLNTAQGKK